MKIFCSLLPRVSGWCVLVCALLADPLSAQRMVLADTGAAPVGVETAVVSTEVTGGIAVTTFDLVFRNPNGRNLEGTFEFPLLDGQSVVRFALDINGVLREAVPVPKEKGRVVFEEIERRRVDPGLLEQTAGNNYRARIFPIPAQGTRHIVIAYQEDLRRVGGQPAYRLPLAFSEALKSFRLSVSLLSGQTQAARLSTTLQLELPAWNEARRIELEKTDFKAVGVLELALPPLAAPALVTGKHAEEEYFLAELPLAGLDLQRARPAPKVLGLLWDISGSGEKRDHQREFAFLEELFKSLGDVRVKLVFLQDRARPMGEFKVTGGNWRKLRGVLEDIYYDGASSLDGLVDDASVDQWLLVGDGIQNYGTTLNARALPVARPVHCILSAAGGDASWLRGVARRSGGEFVDMHAMEAAAAVRALRTQSLRVLSCEPEAGAFAEVFPEAGATVTGELLRVSGKLRRPHGRVRVSIGHDASDAVVRELEVTAGQNPTVLAPRGWAAAKIQTLSDESVANREDIRRTSQEFCIVSADTSLIVLETLADYERYGITPPAEFGDDWKHRRSDARELARLDKRSHLATIVQRFQERVAWWEKEYPKDKYTPSEVHHKGFAAGVVRGGTWGGGAQPARASANGDETIELTPFSVTAPGPTGYAVQNSLAGSRVNTRPNAANLAAPPPPAAPASGSSEDSTASNISLGAWSPDSPYLERLRRANENRWEAIYREERVREGAAPGFYLDVAEFLFQQHKTEDALHVLSNLAELALEDAGLLRVLGHRLMQAGRADLALPIFERVLVIRGEEPQSYRDLALVCIETGAHQRAVDLLWSVVVRPWHDRFPDVELIALAELNALLVTSTQTLDTSAIDPRLIKNMPLGLRVVLSWDADNCDIDLWTRDPNGEDVGYNHPASYQGGRISRDFTGGYGPEEFSLRAPKDGKYVVRVNYFGDRRQNSFGPVTAEVLVYTDFGTPKQKLERMTLRLSDPKENATIGTVRIGK